MENFLRRLEAYIGVPQTPNMADIIVKVMIEVLFILSIATKELNQNSASELIPDDGLHPS
jgi:hypothetical protein